MTNIVLEETSDISGNGKKSLLRGVNGAAMTAGTVSQAIPDFRTAADLLATYGNFSEVNWANGDFVTLTKYSNGQAVTALSVDPLNPGESRVMLNVPVMQPAALEVEASVIRNRQQFATLTLFSNGEDGQPNPVPDPINIVSISQSNATGGAAYSGTAGTTVTLLLETALPEYPDPAAVYLSDWINITGLVDTRLNYQNATINFISADRKTLTFGFSDEAALPSLAIPVVSPTLGTAQVHFYNNLGGAAEGFGLRFTGTTATSAAIVSLFGNGDAQVSGTLFGDHRVTIASTAPQYLNGTMGNVELKATSRFRLEGRVADAAVLDKGIEAPATAWAARASRTAVKPSSHLPLYPRFRIFQPIGMSRPTDEITAISKSGTTTATVTHTGARTYQVNEVVGIYGVRDITNFAQTVGTITAVLSPTQFQLVLGSAVTATSYGGTVSIINGGAAQPGIVGQHVQSVAQVTGMLEWLSVVGNTNWSGLSVGDYVNLHGVIDSGGVDLAVDGAWEVANISTTTMLLKPITSVLGARVSPAMPTIGTTPVNAGGSVLLRTTARMHDLMLETWAENRVMIDGQGTGRVDKSVPVQVLNTVPVSGTVTATVANATVAGTAAVDAAIGNPVTIGLRASNANITAMSAAGDNVAQLGTMIGAAIAKPYALPEAEWAYTGALTATTDVAAQTAAGAGIKRHVTMLQATNTGASAVDVLLRDGTTTRLQVTVPAGQSVVMPLPTGIPTTANTALNVALSAAGTVRVNLLGYTAP
jgi:hypothetical protein